MNVTIESFFCPYCDEVTEAYFLLVNTILFADGEDSLRQGLERLKTQVPLDDYFVYGFGAHHLWVYHKKNKIKSKSCLFFYHLLFSNTCDNIY